MRKTTISITPFVAFFVSAMCHWLKAGNLMKCQVVLSPPQNVLSVQMHSSTQSVQPTGQGSFACFSLKVLVTRGGAGITG